MIQKFKVDENSLVFENYKERIDKAMTNFFKQFINWKTSRSSLSSLGYMGSTLWQAGNKMSGKISALFEGLIFEVTHEDLRSKVSQPDAPIFTVTSTLA